MQKFYAFAAYSVFFEAIIWLPFCYAVFALGHSGWWFFLAVFMSNCQLRPKHFGIQMVEPPCNE